MKIPHRAVIVTQRILHAHSHAHPACNARPFAPQLLRIGELVGIAGGVMHECGASSLAVDRLVDHEAATNRVGTRRGG